MKKECWKLYCTRAEPCSVLEYCGVTKRRRRPFCKKGIRMEKEFLPPEPCHHPVLEHFGCRCGGGILSGHVLGLPLPAEALLAQAHHGVTVSPSLLPHSLLLFSFSLHYLSLNLFLALKQKSEVLSWSPLHPNRCSKIRLFSPQRFSTSRPSLPKKLRECSGSPENHNTLKFKTEYLLSS